MWKHLPFLILHGFLVAESRLEESSMLYQAESIAQKFNLEIAKTPSPPSLPQPGLSLRTASVWFSIDLSEITAPAFETLNQEELWNHLKEIGVHAVYFKQLKQGGSARTGLNIDPKWGPGWQELLLQIQQKKMVLIGDSLGSSTGTGVDFSLALKNEGDYPGLYHLIEIEKPDWKSLPPLAEPNNFANVPWLALQELHKKGYVPEQSDPYVKESRWNATGPIACADGKVRRWIYLKENQKDPVIDWMNPSFAGWRIAAADTLNSMYDLGQKIVKLDDSIGPSAQATLALWTRRLGGFSVLETKGGLERFKKAPTDLIADTLTRPALLHALIAEDAEALKLIYRLFLEEGIDAKRLVHTLQPFDEFHCDWAAFLAEPRKRFKYDEEILTGEALRMRLLKEDAARLNTANRPTWTHLCMSALGFKEFEKDRNEITKTHLLLAFFYAMQPGAFSLSASDLLGTVQPQTLDLLSPNPNALYGSLSSQMKNSLSFAMQLKRILSARADSNIQEGELIAIPQTRDKGLLILVHRMHPSRMLQLLAVNFSKSPANQSLDIPSIRQTTGIDLMTGLAEKKPLSSSTFHLSLPPLSAKAILFQNKCYD